MAEDAGRSTTEFLAVGDGSTSWLPVLAERDILMLNNDDCLLLRLDAAETAPSEYSEKQAENEADVPFPPLGTG